MKLGYRDVEGFLKQPPDHVKMVVVYGPDEGLVRERSQLLGKTVVEDLKDPFNVVDIHADQLESNPSLLYDEAKAISMMGGKRLIIVRGANNKVTETLKSIEDDAENVDSLILLLAENLKPASSLRKFAEKSKVAAALPCYVEDERDLTRFLNTFFTDNGKRIERDAVQLAARILQGDRAVVRSEAEKILTYKGEDTTPITLTDVQHCLGQSHLETLDSLVMATASGQSHEAEDRLDTLLSEGNPPILVLRSLKNYLKRLYVTQSRCQDMDLDAAMNKLHPKVFFKNVGPFKAHMRVWSLPRLKKGFTILQDAEKQTKSSGSLAPELICSRAILALSRLARY